MHIEVHFNPKHESDRIISFLEVLAASGNTIDLVYSPQDFKEADVDTWPTGKTLLEDLAVPKYLQNLSNGIIFVKPDGSRIELKHRG